MSTPTDDNYSKENYEACIAYMLKHKSWSVYNVLIEDGYDPKVNYKALMEEDEK